MVRKIGVQAAPISQSGALRWHRGVQLMHVGSNMIQANSMDL